MIVEDFLSRVRHEPGKVVSAIDFAELVCLAMSMEESINDLERRLSEKDAQWVYENSREAALFAHYNSLIVNQNRLIDTKVADRVRTLELSILPRAVRLFEQWKKEVTHG